MKYQPHPKLALNTKPNPVKPIISLPIQSQSMNPPVQIWKRVLYEKAQEEGKPPLKLPTKLDGKDLVCLIPIRSKTPLTSQYEVCNRNKNNYLFDFLHNWLQSQFRSLGILNWFHPWIVVRHHYFYQSS